MVVCEATFSHECRRSGLNDGTIRKLRVTDDEYRLIFSPNGMLIMIDLYSIFLFYGWLQSLNGLE
jgi:hypothetical protein